MSEPPPTAQPTSPLAGRGGVKLLAALDAFSIDLAGRVCADFGCNVGGFTDVMLRRGAARVYAIDTGYGILDWRLRNEPRVVVMERTSALHAPPPPPESPPERSEIAQSLVGSSTPAVNASVSATRSPVTFIAIDMGWTPQRLCIPAALRWLARVESACIVTLIKPHYEASDRGRASLLRKGILPVELARPMLDEVLGEIPSWGARVRGVIDSPITGGKNRATGNVEFLAWVERAG